MMTEKDLTPYVRQSNEISRTPFDDVSVWLKRILYHVISQVKTGDAPETMYVVQVADIMKESGSFDSPENRNGHDYKEIENVMKAVMKNNALCSDLPDGRKIGVAPISFYEISADKKTIKIALAPQLMRHYNADWKTVGNFTSFPRLEAMGLSNPRAQSLYEFLQSWVNHHEVVVPVKDLYDILHVPKSCQMYKNFKDYLERTVQSITRKTSMTVAYEPVKSGSGAANCKVTHVHFIFDEAEVREREAQLLKSQSQKILKCYNAHKIALDFCKKPKNTPECKVCWERGPMYAKRMALKEANLQD